MTGEDRIAALRQASETLRMGNSVDRYVLAGYLEDYAKLLETNVRDMKSVRLVLTEIRQAILDA